MNVLMYMWHTLHGMYLCTLYKVHYRELNCLCSLVYESQANDAIKPYTMEVFVPFVALLTSIFLFLFVLIDVLKYT